LNEICSIDFTKVAELYVGCRVCFDVYTVLSGICFAWVG